MDKLTLITTELENAAKSQMEGRKKNAAILLIACGEELKKIQAQNQENEELVAAIEPELRRTITRADVCMKSMNIAASDQLVALEPPPNAPYKDKRSRQRTLQPKSINRILAEPDQ